MTSNCENNTVISIENSFHQNASLKRAVLAATTPLGQFSSQHGLKIGHYNIRSLHKKFSELYDLVKLFDILCVSESWLLDGYSDHKLFVPGYKFFRYDRVVDKVGGGLLIYI